MIYTEYFEKITHFYWSFWKNREWRICTRNFKKYEKNMKFSEFSNNPGEHHTSGWSLQAARWKERHGLENHLNRGALSKLFFFSCHRCYSLQNLIYLSFHEIHILSVQPNSALTDPWSFENCFEFDMGVGKSTCWLWAKARVSFFSMEKWYACVMKKCECMFFYMHEKCNVKLRIT